MKSEVAFFKDKRWRDFVQFCQLIRFLGFTDDEIIAEVRKIMAAINTEPSPSDVSVTQDVLMDIKKDDTCPDCGSPYSVCNTIYMSCRPELFECWKYTDAEGENE